MLKLLRRLPSILLSWDELPSLTLRRGRITAAIANALADAASARRYIRFS